MSDAERLTKLEERYAHLQRHQAEQDKVTLGLADELAKLRKELAGLRTRQLTGGEGQESEPADERPPHY
ncbi:MAG: SlyX family protein [Lacunisphaera sp.]